MKKIFFPHLLMLVRVMAFVHSLYIATSLFSSIFFYEIAHFISSVVTKVSWNNSMDSNRHCNKPLQKPTCVVLLKSVLYIRWSFLSKGFNIQFYYLGYRITHRPAAAKVKINGNIHWYHTHLTWELYFVPSSATGMGKCLPGSAKQWPPPKVFKHIQLTRWVASQEAKEKTVISVYSL